MKKLILVLAILVVAAPAFALDINLVRQGTTNKVDVRYTGADPCNLPRAFALVINVNSPTAVITVVSDYKTTGESTSASRGYGIYPATIAIEANGTVTGWGTPVASDSDPLPAGADQVVPSRNIVLEFGSLYAPVHDGTNSPAVDGNLCSLTIDCNGASGNVPITVKGETTYRGGVVLENRTTFAISKTLDFAACSNCGCFSCSDPKYAQWVLQGMPPAWCCLHQRDGDATGDGSVSGSDLIRLKASYGLSFGQVGYDCRADFTHDGAVSGPDLIRLKSNYGINYGVACQADSKDKCGLDP
ncbi:MAG: hypothetical protein ABSE89_09250 [Sedimentisphaerales bacterium]